MMASMAGEQSPVTGKDVAGAGMLMLAVNGVCAGVGAGLGSLVHATGAGLIAGFLVGFFAAIAVVVRRFKGS